MEQELARECWEITEMTSSSGGGRGKDRGDSMIVVGIPSNAFWAENKMQHSYINTENILSECKYRPSVFQPLNFFPQNSYGSQLTWLHKKDIILSLCLATFETIFYNKI